MRHTFHTYIKKYQAVRPERLYGDFRDYTETAFTTDDASLYFVVKCMAAEWLPHTFVVSDDYRLSGLIRVDQKEHEVFLDMAAFWFAMPKMQELFQTKSAMADYFMTRSKALAGQSLQNEQKYRQATYISLEASDSEKLVVECELWRNMNKDRQSLTEIYVYQAINFFDLPGPKLNVIYIGSSITNTFKRLYKHEKWGRMQAEKKRNEDILVYFAELEGDAIQHESANGLSLLARNEHGVSNEDETLITEMALINYFKPQYNWLHKDRDISYSERVERALKKADFNEVTVELILEGPLGALGTPHTGTYGSHTAIHKIA
ncbi:MAG: hypothetical protein NT087_09405 [Deltaproteobacteria bacterium]|nr:hypothetical protein [Deltaproteobacteria bacterium]